MKFEKGDVVRCHDRGERSTAVGWRDGLVFTIGRIEDGRMVNREVYDYYAVSEDGKLAQWFKDLEHYVDTADAFNKRCFRI